MKKTYNLGYEKGKYYLEYSMPKNDEYSILKIVADNIDGGIYTIQQRVKRYEKNI